MKRFQNAIEPGVQILGIEHLGWALLQESITRTSVGDSSFFGVAEGRGTEAEDPKQAHPEVEKDAPRGESQAKAQTSVVEAGDIVPDATCEQGR